MNLLTGPVVEPAEIYHSRREYISSSLLPHMAKSPQHFLKAWTAPSKAPTTAMEKGTFMHEILLEQNMDRYVPRPKKDGRLVASNTNEYKAFLAANPGKTPIDPDLHTEAMAILGSACASPRFLKAFETTIKEASFYAFHEDTGLDIKARPDMLASDFSFIADVKTTANIARFENQIFDCHYDVRLVHYAETIKAATGKVIPDSEYYFFAMESSDPYGMKTFRLRPDDVVNARAQWQRWMNEISVCKQDDKWPSYEDLVIDVARPRYLALMADVAFGEVAG